MSFQPAQVSYKITHADVLFATGQFDAAWELIQPFVVAGTGGPQLARGSMRKWPRESARNRKPFGRSIANCACRRYFRSTARDCIMPPPDYWMDWAGLTRRLSMPDAPTIPHANPTIGRIIQGAFRNRSNITRSATSSRSRAPPPATAGPARMCPECRDPGRHWSSRSWQAIQRFLARES